MRRRDDRLYVKSALATLAFYAGVLAACAAAGFFLRFWALGALALLLAWLYRGEIFAASRPRAPLDVDEMIRAERTSMNSRTDEPVPHVRPGEQTPLRSAEDRKTPNGCNLRSTGSGQDRRKAPVLLQPAEERARGGSADPPR